MPFQQKKVIGIITVLIILLCVALFLWLKPDLSSDTSSNSASTAQNPNAGTETTSAIPATAQSLVGASQKDTQINCQIRTDSSNRLMVNEQTKDCFEYFITQYGEKSIEQIKADFITYIKMSYKDPVMSQLNDLWSRYMQYREQLGNMQPPAGLDPKNQDDPKYFRSIISNTHSLRKKFFSDYEIEGLFGTQDTYDTYTVDRMEVMNDSKLTAEQKAVKLKELFNQLPEDWQENLKQINQLEELRHLTAEIKARGGSAAEIRQMRTNLVGPEATARLENLDVQRGQWKEQVTHFLSERDNIMQSSMSDSAKQSALEQLRNQSFSTAPERLRVQTFEQVHDQGGKLPFAD